MCTRSNLFGIMAVLFSQHIVSQTNNDVITQPRKVCSKFSYESDFYIKTVRRKIPYMPDLYSGCQNLRFIIYRWINHYYDLISVLAVENNSMYRCVNTLVSPVKLHLSSVTVILTYWRQPVLTLPAWGAVQKHNWARKVSVNATSDLQPQQLWIQ